MISFFKKKPAEPAQLYTKCNILPVHNFNEIATNNDFNYLKVNKTDVVSDIELETAWLVILDEYFRISKNTQGFAILKKKTSLLFLEKKLQVFEALQICLLKNINVDIEMKMYKTNKDILKIHIGMVKNDINRILKSLPGEDEGVKDENDFDRSLAVLSQAGFKIDRFATVVSEWVQMLRVFESQQTKKEN
jgi:hypothetical protein